MRHQRREAHHLAEEIFESSLPGRLAASDATVIIGRRLNNPLLPDDGIDQSNVMRLHQVRQLGLDGREIAGLDLDQQTVSNDVDDEPVHGDLESIARLRIPLLDGRVERLLIEDTDS